MDKKEILKNLQDQSTWRLLLLTLVSLGIYGAHYIKRQTSNANQYLDEKGRIPTGLVYFILVLSYIYAIFTLLSIFAPIESPIDEALTVVLEAAIIVWGFKARNRMNTLFSARKGDANWFNGFWTFVFTPLYFNFKVNTLNDLLLEQDDKPEGESGE
ncbi:MAG: DUF4234 domain-containing protein [Proteobacteria bacterium]|nr:DUF4234 domain-containing protein [Pseudomonadota bacterium]